MGTAKETIKGHRNFRSRELAIAACIGLSFSERRSMAVTESVIGPWKKNCFQLTSIGETALLDLTLGLFETAAF